MSETKTVRYNPLPYECDDVRPDFDDLTEAEAVCLRHSR